MRCEKVQTLHGPYLDSELDAKTALEIEQHLKGCPDCARVFNEEQELAARLKAGLNQGGRTAALWEGIERAVVAGAVPASTSPQPPPHVPLSAHERGLFAALREQLEAGWRRSRLAWAGIAAAWAVILVLNAATPEANEPRLAGQALPSSSEMRLAWKQKQQLMGGLSFVPEPTPADKLKAAPPSPRSDRRQEALNT